MNKAKWVKTGMTIAGLVLAGLSTVISDKVKNNEMQETIKKEVSKEVAEFLNNQVKES